MNLDRGNIEKIARTPEDRVLLAKVWDKISMGIRKNIPASTCFLAPRELEMTRCLFGQVPGLTAFGGYAEAERQMLVYLPDYLDACTLYEEDSPIACIRACVFGTEIPSHRDFHGALMGAGIARETVGDICISKDSCDILVTQQVAPYLLQNLTSAGRFSLRISQISLSQLQLPEPEIRVIHDTVASLRLDSVISSGFRISRSLAAQAIVAGKAAIDGLPCEKPDRPVPEGAKVSLRGSGKIQLFAVNGQTRKGRYSVEIHRYI